MTRDLIARLATSAATALTLLVLYAQAADKVTTVARFTPAKGLISDAALLGDGHIALAYPEQGHIADYGPEGKLYRHVLREGGMEVAFRPTFISAAPDNDGLVAFDEAEHHVFHIALDGNISKGVDLAMPEAGGTPIALAHIGGLTPMANGSLWTMLPDRGVLAHFDKGGKLGEALDFTTLLPYPGGVYVRGQALESGAVYVLDYHQGAIVYRSAASGQFRRLQLAGDTAFDAQPSVQDFAVSASGTILAATTNSRRPLLLLKPGAKGYVAHPVSLQLGTAGGTVPRIAVRYSRGKFILWTDAPLVYVLQLD